MITDGKRITDMALSTATLGSFAIPVAGPFVATAIGVSQLLFDIFYPTPPIDPDTLPATKVNLDAAITGLKKFILHDKWLDTIDAVQGDVTNSNDDFLHNWHKMAALGLNVLSVDDDPKQYVVCDSAAFTTGDLAKYFNLGLPNNVPSVLSRKIEDLTLTLKAYQLADSLEVLNHRTQTTSLFCLIAGLKISYWKALVVWRWGREHLEWNAWQHYWSQKAWWDGKNENFHQQHESKQPVQPTLAEDAQPPDKAPDWNNWRLTTDSAVADLTAAVSDILSYAEGTTAKPGLYNTMQTHWDQRAKTVVDRLSKLSIQTDGTNFWYLDAANGDTSPKTVHRSLAEFYMEGKCGALIAYLWDYWSQTYGIDGVREEDLTAFRDAIQLWKRARNSVSFTTYTVNKGDTLASIAATVMYPKGYPKVGTRIYPADSRYAWILYFANRSALKLADTMGSQSSVIERVHLEDGEVLEIPDGTTVQVHAALAGDTLKKIAAKYYGSDVYDKLLYEVNRPVLKQEDYASGSALALGTSLLIPDYHATTYTVVEGDTLQSVAAHFYNYEQYDTLLYEANIANLPPPAPGSPEWERVTLSAGQVLNLPGLADSCTVAAGDTLKSVALRYYATERVAWRIFEENKDTLEAAGAVAPDPPVPSREHTPLSAGQVLEIPDISTAKFTVYKTAAGDTYMKISQKLWPSMAIEGIYIDTMNNLNILDDTPLPQGRVLRIPSSIGVPHRYILTRPEVVPFNQDDPLWNRPGRGGGFRGGPFD